MKLWTYLCDLAMLVYIFSWCYMFSILVPLFRYTYAVLYPDFIPLLPRTMTFFAGIVTVVTLTGVTLYFSTKAFVIIFFVVPGFTSKTYTEFSADIVAFSVTCGRIKMWFRSFFIVLFYFLASFSVICGKPKTGFEITTYLYFIKSTGFMFLISSTTKLLKFLKLFSVVTSFEDTAT